MEREREKDGRVLGREKPEARDDEKTWIYPIQPHKSADNQNEGSWLYPNQNEVSWIYPNSAA